MCVLQRERKREGGGGGGVGSFGESVCVCLVCVFEGELTSLHTLLLSSDDDE